MRKTAANGQSGITLIEVMVAMAILSIISTMIWGSFTQTSRHKDYIDAEIGYYHEIRSAMDRMVRELSMAYVSVQLNPSPSLQSVRTVFNGKERGDFDRIDFTSFSHNRLFQNAHESDQNEISYFVAEDPENPSEHVLARREQRRPDGEPDKGGNSQIMVSNVTGFELEYLDPLSNEWLRTWDATQINAQPNRMPLQVKIILRVKSFLGGKEKEETFATRAMLPIRYAINHAVYSP